MNDETGLSGLPGNALNGSYYGRIMKIVSSKPFLYLLPLISLWSYFASCVRNMQGASGYYLIHYLYTYRKGFVPRGLVGEVISLFKEKVSTEDTRKIIIIFGFLLVTAVALCIGRALVKCRHDNFRLGFIAVLITFACINSYSLSYFMTDVKLDKLVWALTFFAVFLAGSKKTVWLVPFICFAATLSNPVFLFCGNILVSVILLNEFREHKYSKYYGIICVFAYVVMIAIGLYGPYSESKLGFADEQEMIDFYFSRFAGELPESALNEFLTEWIFDYFNNTVESFWLGYKYYFVEWGNGMRTIRDAIITAIPFFTVSGIFWVNVMKREKNRFGKFIYFLCLVSPLVTIVPTVFSWEGSKYFSSLAIDQLCLAVYFICRNETSVIETLHAFCGYMRQHFAVVLAASAYFVLMAMAG